MHTRELLLYGSIKETEKDKRNEINKDVICVMDRMRVIQSRRLCATIFKTMKYYIFRNNEIRGSK